MEHKLSFELGAQVGADAHFGLIVLQSDETLEYEFAQVFSKPEWSLHTSRVKSGDEVTVETLAEMENDLTGAAGLFPKSARYDVVGYGCTSGTSVIGAKRIADLVRLGCHTTHVTEPVSALVAACKAMGVKRLAFLSPYIGEVSQTLRQVLVEQGLDITVFGSFQEQLEENVARITPSSVVSASQKLVSEQNVDALFLSCTNLQSFSIVEELEQSLQCPVLSSNLVLAWHMMTLAGICSHRTDMGSLLREH